MSTETNKEIVRRFTVEVLNQGNMATLEEVCTPDLLNHNPPPGLPGAREGLKMSVCVECADTWVNSIGLTDYVKAPQKARPVEDSKNEPPHGS